MAMERKDPILSDDSVELKEACGLTWDELQARVAHTNEPRVSSTEPEDVNEANGQAPIVMPRNPLTEAEMMYILQAISPAIETRVQDVVAKAMEAATLQAKAQLDQTLKLHVHDAIMETLRRVDISSE